MNYNYNQLGMPTGAQRMAQPSLYGPNPQAGQPALAQNLPAAPPPRPPIPGQPGILAQGETQNGQANIGGILSGPARRDQTPLSTPNLRIGANEAMMRIGGAGVRASQNGGLEAIGAMTDQLGAIEDTNRSTALAEYQAAMEAEASKEKPEDNSERIGQIDQTLYDMNRAKAALAKGGVTGFFDTYLAGIWDKARGNDDQNTRKLLAKLQVDDTLLRIAQTKGAISNKEMDLFLSPAPTMSDQETVWIKWIEDREFALGRIRDRLSTGAQVNDIASEDKVNQFGTSVTGFNLTEAQQALVDANS